MEGKMRGSREPFGTICIVGVGLVGGSLGLAIRNCGTAGTVVGCDIDLKALSAARKTGAIDYGTSDIVEAVKEADIVVLSTPVETFGQLAEQMLPSLKPGAIVTDTGSTKGEIVRKLQLLISGNNEFVGGHPMTGSEKGGIRAADQYLFENAVYVLTPTEANTDSAIATITALGEAVGSNVVIMDPEEHDSIVAAVSHVPHITASSLVGTLMEISREYPAAPLLAAGGFRDTTRIAAGDPDLWLQICFSNREKVVSMLDVLCSKLMAARQYIKEGNRQELRAFLAEAREQRLKIPSRLRGILPGLFELVVTVPDRPGVIGFISVLLGKNNVNIIDIEILRVREGDGGTIRLGFQSEKERDRAEAVLKENHVPVKRL